MFHKFQKGETERQSKGGKTRAQRMTPERRAEVATIGAAIRWAKAAGWEPYTRNGSNLERINERLAKLIALEAKAWVAGNDDMVLRCIMAALPWERMRMWQEANAGKPGGPAMELGESMEDEAARRLKESRARREQALGLQEGETVVEMEGKDDGSESK